MNKSFQLHSLALLVVSRSLPVAVDDKKSQVTLIIATLYTFWILKIYGNTRRIMYKVVSRQSLSLIPFNIQCYWINPFMSIGVHLVTRHLLMFQKVESDGGPFFKVVLEC